MLQQPEKTDTAADQYLIREERYAAEATSLEKSSSSLSNLRLIVFLLTLVVPLISYNLGNLPVATVVLLIGGLLFVFLVLRHGTIIDRLETAKRLLQINRQGMDRINGEWDSLKHQGEQFLDRSHPYAVDLDIFGRCSLFQLICTAHSPQGQERLAGILSGPSPIDVIRERQMAIMELASKLDWRQKFEESVMNLEGKQWDSLLLWSESRGEAWFVRGTAGFLRCLPVLTLGGGAAGYFLGAGLVPLAALLVVQMLLAIAIARSLRSRIVLLDRQQRDLGLLESALGLFEKEAFSSDLVRRLMGTVCADGSSAANEIGALRANAGWLQMRNNPPVHFALNTLFLWDFQWIVSAEKWRLRNGGRIRGWLATLAEFEALGSLAVIQFENPDWPFPKVTEQGGEPFKAVGLGHPLLPSTVRKTNNLRIERNGSICLITGSNMSGKSTFLRSLGINLVLAYTGAPVCARTLSCAYMPLYTSMRVTDDLSSGVSSFYAELLRVKMIIEAARKQPVFCLIDEIFRGTNSRDRLRGAGEVLRTLTALNATGLVSTHDLELSKLAEIAPGNFKNFHFSEHYTEDGIEFEYRLQPGESQTTNAVYLMKQLGIMQR